MKRTLDLAQGGRDILVVEPSPRNATPKAYRLSAWAIISTWSEPDHPQPAQVGSMTPISTQSVANKCNSKMVCEHFTQHTAQKGETELLHEAAKHVNAHANTLEVLKGICG